MRFDPILLTFAVLTGCAGTGPESPPAPSGSGSSSGAAGSASGGTGSSGASTSGKSGSSSGAGTGSSGTAKSGSSGTGSGSATGSTSGAASGGMDGGVGDGGDTGGFLDAGPVDCLTLSTPAACAPPADMNKPICNLSMTGCMMQADPTKFAANAHPYEVNSPLWSDNAAKTRAFVLPAGGKIHVLDCKPGGGADLSSCVAPDLAPTDMAVDDGRWIFPIGSVMIKNFMFGGKLVETRLLVRVDAATAMAAGDDWLGYSYAWNEAQTDAKVLPSNRFEVSFNTGSDAGTVSWRYPSRVDCNTCHSPSTGGGTLGLETDQMNRVVGATNQIDAFATLGLFDVAPSKPYQAALVEPYTNPALGLTGTAGATVEQEARSYLAVNCGFCHRPDYNDLGFDLRYNLSLANSGLCANTAQKPATGVTIGTTLLLDPGHHANSALWVRPDEAIPADASTDLQAPTEYYRMPQVATYVVDPQGTAVVAQWVDSLTSCP
jgi:hypothetical protein